MKFQTPIRRLFHRLTPEQLETVREALAPFRNEPGVDDFEYQICFLVDAVPALRTEAQAWKDIKARTEQLQALQGKVEAIKEFAGDQSSRTKTLGRQLAFRLGQSLRQVTGQNPADWLSDLNDKMTLLDRACTRLIGQLENTPAPRRGHPRDEVRWAIIREFISIYSHCFPRQPSFLTATQINRLETNPGDPKIVNRALDANLLVEILRASGYHVVHEILTEEDKGQGASLYVGICRTAMTLLSEAPDSQGDGNAD